MSMRRHWNSTIPYYLIVPVLFLLLVSRCPIESALSIGGDDGFELAKSLLVARAPEAARDMYNDQPWLHTLVIGQLFRWFGPHASIPRLVSVISALALVVALGYLASRTGGGLEVILVGLFFLSSEYITTAALAAMVELPAVAWAMVASTILIASERNHWGFRGILLSGIMLGLALSLKLTAVIVIPATAVYLLAQRRLRAAFWTCSAWVAIAAACFTGVALLSPRCSFDELWGSHSLARQALSPEQMKTWAFHGYHFVTNPALTFAAGLGLIRAVRRREKELIYATALLGTAVVIAIFQRPWWGYYVIHFYTPMSLLAAAAAGDVMYAVFSRTKAFTAVFARSAAHGFGIEQPASRSAMTFACAVAGLAMIIGLWSGFTLPRWLYEIGSIEQVRRAENSVVCRAMRQYVTEVKWCYTPEREYAFHAGLLVPPELIVLSIKRFLTGSLTNKKVLEVLKRYEPELLLLSKRDLKLHGELSQWVRLNYTLVEQEDIVELWVRREIARNPLGASDPRLVAWKL